MIEILEAKIKPHKGRIAIVGIKYYDLVIKCDICLYKYEKLYIRLPEIWKTLDTKLQMVFWPDRSKSEEFQKTVLNKVFDKIGLTLENAIEIKKNFYRKEKTADNKIKTI